MTNLSGDFRDMRDWVESYRFPHAALPTVATLLDACDATSLLTTGVCGAQDGAVRIQSAHIQ